MLDNKTRALYLLVAAIFSGSFWVACGSDDAAVANSDGGLGGDADQLGGGDAASKCESIGAGCTTGSVCCVNACTSNVCGGTQSVGDGGTVTKVCNSAGAVCAKGFDCCSGTCNGGTCIGSTLGGDGGVTASGPVSCGLPKTACTGPDQCCSGLCEPVTGSAGNIQCLDACKADGVACTTAQDCCSLGCFGGSCGGGGADGGDKLCLLESDTCTVNADCCSNLCDPGTHQCMIDPANSTCRPTGETCNSGPQKGCCGATNANDLCDKVDFNPPRCIAPPTGCKGDTATCTTDADCCGGHCDATSKTCATVCTPTAGACTTGFDCCTSSCTNGSCDAPLPPPVGGGNPDGGAPICGSIGTACISNAACCSGACLGGFCARPPA